MRPTPRALPIAAVALGLLASSPAGAVALPADGGDLQLPGTGLADAPGLAGPVIARTQTPLDVRMTLADPFDSEGDGDFTIFYQTHAVLDAWVVRAQDRTLDFYWQVSNDARSEGYFDVVEVESFGAAAGTYDVDWRRDLPGTSYPSVTSARIADGSRSIAFGFSDEFVRDAMANRSTTGSTRATCPRPSSSTPTHAPTTPAPPSSSGR